MKETQKFRMENGSEVTVSELGQGEYAEDKIMLMLEGVEDESMALVLSKKVAWAIGRAMMHLGYESTYREDE